MPIGQLNHKRIREKTFWRLTMWQIHANFDLRLYPLKVI